MNEPLLVRREGSVLVLVNNNPAARNALTPGYYKGLREALVAAASDPEVGAIVLTGAEGYFCSGGNLKQLITRRDMSEAERRAGIDAGLNGMIRAIRDCPQPVIAAVDGGAAGAGVTIALACDMLIMARDAYLTLAYVKAGLTPDGGATAFMSQVLPRQLMTELVLTGDRISAERLEALGVANHVVDPGAAEREAIVLAGRLAAGPMRAMARIKSLARSAYDNSAEEQMAAEAGFMATSLGDAESAEGIAAFLEKRRPDYPSLRKSS